LSSTSVRAACESKGFPAETLTGDFVGQSAGGQNLKRNIAI
jgi:hypothetical protein